MLPLQKKSQSERDSFIEGLAAVNAAKNNIKKERVLRRILHEEEQRLQNGEINTAFKN